MNKKIIIVGAGISGATLANILANKGWDVTIYEKQNHIGGNCYDSYNDDKVLVHNYGPHIFHTSDEDVYKFINKFTKLNSFVNKVLVCVDNKLFPLPINFKSIEIIMGDRAKETISVLKQTFVNKKTITIGELKTASNNLVQELYQYILKNVYMNYSAKMWGKKFDEIDPNTINRVKIVLSYYHNYFPEDKYQGLPSDGYTKMIEKMLNHPNIHLKLNSDVTKLINLVDGKIQFNNQIIDYPFVYCGPIDEILKYNFGPLPYRSLDIRFETIKVKQFQETAVVNYPADLNMTRIAEYKQMTLQDVDVTTISKEYPGEFNLKSDRFNIRYYPIINNQNTTLYNKYVEAFKKYEYFYPLGRLAQYKYLDMDDAIKQAFELAKKLDNE